MSSAGTTDTDDATLTHAWRFGDGTTSTTGTVSAQGALPTVRQRKGADRSKPSSKPLAPDREPGASSA